MVQGFAGSVFCQLCSGLMTGDGLVRRSTSDLKPI
jgi:hypothetical protein